ncbi:MAG TPA: mechanosensitive ion channel [Nitrososphaeria archaeon]|nr:mechanosensitive ion channel [Nitrososphaeria archaeon]
MIEMNPVLNDLLLRVLIAAAVLILTYFLSRYARVSLERAFSKFGAGFAKKLAEIIRYFIIFMGVATAVSVLSLDVMAISVIIAAVLIFLLVSMRDIVLNLAAELYLATRRPFKENDWVRVGEIEGTVKSIGGMDTEIITYEGDLVIIPNSYFLRNPIVNKSQSLVRYVELKLTIPKMKLDKVEEAVTEVLSEIKPELLGEPELLSMGEKEDKIEVVLSLPIVNVRKLRWLTAKITKGFYSRGIEVEVE